MYGLNIDLYTWASQGSSADRSQWREPTRTSDGLCSLYEAALCLFEEVRTLKSFFVNVRNQIVWTPRHADLCPWPTEKCVVLLSDCVIFEKMCLDRFIFASLLFQVCRMASDYSRTCVSPDSIQTGEAPVVSETCEVYVWGSNSSHQLVEGTQEKILQPKLAASFADAQTVGREVLTRLLWKHLFSS